MLTLKQTVKPVTEMKSAGNAVQELESIQIIPKITGNKKR